MKSLEAEDIRMCKKLSPSMRREWIEMSHCCRVLAFPLSPSMRREWIEIQWWEDVDNVKRVSLHAEGVD